MKLSESERDLLAYYHLTSCAWVYNPSRECDCGLIRKVAAIVAHPDAAVSA